MSRFLNPTGSQIKEGRVLAEGAALGALEMEAAGQGPGEAESQDYPGQWGAMGGFKRGSVLRGLFRGSAGTSRNDKFVSPGEGDAGRAGRGGGQS